jgi:GT2 family glycosyltransferase
VSAPPATPRVAVVIVNYQSYAELRDCLASFGPPAPDLQTVVVDHATDPGHADNIAAAFPHVQLLRVAANEGFAAGVNRGVRHCASRYALLLNPDSIVEPGAWHSLADWMDANPNVGAAGPRIRNSDGSVQPSARRFPDFTTGIAGRSSWLTRVFPGNPLSRHNLAPSSRPDAAPTQVDWVSGACMIVRREAFDRVGGMDDGFFLYWEDADFCRRLKHAGWRVVYTPGVSVLHMGGRSSRHAADASLVAFHDSAYRLFSKHATAPARLLSPLVYLALRARLALMRRIVRRRERRQGLAG